MTVRHPPILDGAVLVTGANGFVGTVLCKALAQRGTIVRRAIRRTDATKTDPHTIALGELHPATPWEDALDSVSVVIHLAARTHVMRETVADALTEYRRINVAGTEGLGRAAARSGVRRLIYMSSIKVNGERTTDKPFTEDSPPRPEDNYGVSKWEAEQALWKIARETGLEIVVLRPPLLYGPGVKGNFLSLLRAVDAGVPLPLASVKNRRSLLYVGDLVSAILACIDNAVAAGKTYLVADQESFSTPDLVRNVAVALGKKARLLPCPPALLRAGAALLGRSAAAARLTESLVVDASRLSRDLDWRPPTGAKAGLAATSQWYYEARVMGKG